MINNVSNYPTNYVVSEQNNPSPIIVDEQHYQFAEELVKQNNLPPYSKIIVDEKGNLSIEWDKESLGYFINKYPDLFDKINTPAFSLTMNFPVKGAPTLDVRYSGAQGGNMGIDFFATTPLAQLNLIMPKDPSVDESRSSLPSIFSISAKSKTK